MKKAICSLAMIGMLGTAISAQETPNLAGVQPPEPGTSSSSEMKSKISAFNKATSFLGAPVMNQKGEQIGKVQDLVFDLEEGELGYAVLALGSGEKSRNVPVPVRSLKVAEGERHLVLNMSESILAAAEGVTDGAWPATDVFAVGRPAESETGSARSSDESSAKEE